MSGVDVDDVPWTTAPEHAEDAMRELGITEDSDLWNHVDRLAAQYGLEEPLAGTSPTPATVAAGSIYLVCLLRNAKRTQETVAAATGVSRVAIRNCYHSLCEAEDIPVSGRAGGTSVGDVDTDDTVDQSRDLTEWARGFLNREGITPGTALRQKLVEGDE